MKRREALVTLSCVAFLGPNLFSKEGRSIQMKKENQQMHQRLLALIPRQ
jgi:hypothetical protein